MIEMGMDIQFASDERVAGLLKAATAHKSSGDWGAALAVLAEAKSLMLVSSVSYPAETWCRLPLYLQQAGRMEESMKEFQFLLDDLERRARRDSFLDDPNVGNPKRKEACYKLIIREDN